MRARKVDANLKSIVDAARKLGLMVNVRNDDCADLDVQVRGSNVAEIWEVKASGGRYTKRQKKLRAAGWCIRLITCVVDVLAAKQTMLADAEAMRKARLLRC